MEHDLQWNMQAQQIKTMAVPLATGVLIGALATLVFTCHGSTASSPATPSVATTTIHQSQSIGTVGGMQTPTGAPRATSMGAPRVANSTTIVDTGKTVWVGVCDSTCLSVPTPLAAATPPFRLSSFFGPMASVVAAFVPEEPRQILEIYGQTEHDFLGGYGGQASVNLNLDRLHIANATLFVAFGYLHSFYFAIGVFGKLYGLW